MADVGINTMPAGIDLRSRMPFDLRESGQGLSQMRRGAACPSIELDPMMTQMNDPYGNPSAKTHPDYGYGSEQGMSAPAKTSITAILSLVCALFICIPGIAQTLGLFLGFIAVFSIMISGGRRKGLVLAISGIVISGVLLTGIGLGGFAIYGFVKTMGRSIPETFFTTVEIGDMTATRALLAPQLSQSISDEELALFQAKLSTEFGKFQSGEFVFSGEPMERSGRNQYQNAFPFPMKLRFDQGDLIAAMILEQPQSGQQSPPTNANGQIIWLEFFKVQEIIFVDPSDSSVWYFPQRTAAPPVPAIEESPTTEIAPPLVGDPANEESPSETEDDANGG